MDKLYDKIKGALYGVSVGDALGAPLEFMSADEIKEKYGTVKEMLPGGWLNVQPGEITDDTQMTLAVCGGIEANYKNPIPEIGKMFIDWYNSRPKDIGGTCAASIQNAMVKGNSYELTESDWLNAAKETDVQLGGKSDGNGALMRNVYPGLFYSDIDTATENSIKIAKMTHYGKYSANACIIYTFMINCIMEHSDIEDNLKRLKRLAEINSKYTGISEIKPIHEYNLIPNGYVLNSFKCALAALFSSNSAEEAIISAVNLGGDADTIGAITGGLAGALYGYTSLPHRWTERLDKGISKKLDYFTNAALENRR